MDIWKVFSNKNRRNILKLLSEKSYHVNEIINVLNVAPKSVINHLNLLEMYGFIQSSQNKENRRKYYTIVKNIHIEILVTPNLYDIKVNSLQFENENDNNKEIIIQESNNNIYS